MSLLYRPWPLPSMNGSGRDNLVQPLLDAFRQTELAIKAVQQTAPHGRDFVGRADDYAEARRRFNANLVKLHEVREYLVKNADRIDDAFRGVRD
jgi:hypothetical protein